MGRARAPSGDLTMSAAAWRDRDRRPGLQDAIPERAVLSGNRRINLQVLGETVFVAREAARARKAVAPNLFRIPRSIDALVTDGRKEGRLQRQREYVERAPLDCQRLHGCDDGPPDA